MMTFEALCKEIEDLRLTHNVVDDERVYQETAHAFGLACYRLALTHAFVFQDGKISATTTLTLRALDAIAACAEESLNDVA